MGTKTLKEKIFDIAFWTVYFFCAFLIVGYLINSGFLKVVPAKDKIYEILKDALSISAAFLAPVAAFVLFSDWREQHRAIKIESESEVVYQELRKLFLTFKKSLLAIRTNIQDKNLFKEEEEKNKIHLDILNTTLSSLSSRMGNDAVKEFIEVVDEILEKYYKMYKIFDEIRLFHKYQVHQPNKELLEKQLPGLIEEHVNNISISQGEVLDILYIDIRRVYFLSTKLKA
ncbi:hypothetical protein [Acinetobacter bereziniae]|uniref:Uncharacterized protein n=1 Tax=Acinetobacter bereziniae NIPH 3 TaxID=1217651 RepID=N8YN17_ACIBZ|nr:hypothetical protein [Acinetobacter bereziniae]ENV20958.1 hypothetical protein F963_03089 [Acinetobacter bereziniae NIPH 3]MDR6542970.1 hypothetical protein [Acinetobacter bereziniae]